MSDETDLQALNERWGDAFNAGDVPAMMSVYEPDAIIVPGPDAEPLQGTEAIEGSLRAFLGLGGKITATPRHWVVNGDVALGSVSWVIAGGSDPEGHPIELRGITSEVVRRQPDGSWRYVIDHPFGGG